jgi:cell division protein FtsL
MEILLLLGLAIVIIMIVSVISTRNKNRTHYDSELQNLRNKVDNLEKENTELKKQNTIAPSANKVKIQAAAQKTIPPTITAKNNLPQKIELTEEFKATLYIMEQTSQSIFITGKAGTGKSTLIEYFKRNTQKNVIYLAPTGVAALHIRGKTIHSFFQIKPGLIKKDAKDERIKKIPNKLGMFRQIETIIIDEVSMVRADLMDGIDYALRLNRGIDKPFGGVQMVFVGDLYQLPPVVKGDDLAKYIYDTYGGPWFFNSDIISKLPHQFYKSIQCCELTRIFRQDESKQKQFIDLLNALRVNEITDAQLALLKTRFKIGATKNIDPDEIRPVICTRNQMADNINASRLKELSTRAYTYYARIQGKFMGNKAENFPTLSDLTLKEDAQIMMLINDPDGRWVNGTMGLIKNLYDDYIEVTINGITYPVEQHTWEDIEYKYDILTKKITETVIGTFTQYPVNLAWAFTIHKSQGQTFDRVTIMPQGAWEHGQVYVAISRCTSLEGIILDTPLSREDIIVKHIVRKFINVLRQQGQAPVP